MTPGHTLDIDAAYAIHQEVQPNPWSRNTFADCFTPPYFSLILRTNKQISGYALILLVADEATLMDIAVMKKSRGQGLGKALLLEVISHCKQQKMAEIWLEVRASNALAQSLYEQLGFEVIEIRKNYYSTSTAAKEDAVIMRLTL
jgi:ribosomal-protein-alanine N-acetyltransferase